MFNSVALDVVIGLVFIYLLYSLLVSIVQEIIATNLGFRAKILEKSIIRMLEDEPDSSASGNRLTRLIKPFSERLIGYVDMFRRKNHLADKSFVKAFYSHPLIKYMSEDKYYNKPSYITAANFSKVLIDLLHGTDHNSDTCDINKIRESITEGKLLHNNMLPLHQQSVVNEITKINEDTRLMLLSLLQESKGDIALFKNHLEQWFIDTQDRASGWYKKYTQVILFIVGLCISITFNVDTIAIVKKLSKDPQLRSEMIQSAIAFSEKNSEISNKLIALEQQKKDTTLVYKNLKVLADTLYNKNIRLVQEADSLIKNDIASVNNLLGLGWNNIRWNELDINGGKWYRWGLYGNGWADIGKNFNSLSIIGWLLTALALSLGAPFWFDILNKLIKLRGAKKDEHTSVSTSKVNTNLAAPPQPIQVTINNTQQEEEAVG